MAFSPCRRRAGSWLAIALLFGLAAPVAGAGTPAPQAPRIANYRISATLDPTERKVTGEQLLHWVNETRKPAAELRFHLYLNAFANNKTLLMSESPEATERWARQFPGEWGSIEVTQVRIGDTDVTPRFQVIEANDENVHDRTVARLPLERPVLPGRSIDVHMRFVSRLPRLFRRSGHAAPFFLVAQWYPKIGVFQNGKWHCSPYHPNAEFFADFGVYDVQLTVPKGYVVGHTGVAIAERSDGDQRTIEVRAQDVHDFAWAADPRFVVIEEEIGKVRTRALLQPHHAAQGQRYLRALRASLQRYEEWFGAYPYGAVTLVDPGPGGAPAAGMEYPMLFTAGTAWWMPSGIRLPELLTVHEFGHQYWQGIVASDEITEPWLDEGINTYVEGKIMEDLFGPTAAYVDVLGLHLDAVALRRFFYLASPTADPVARSASSVLDRRSYRAAAYAKPALTLLTLERFLGTSRLRQALASYYETWRFRHPTGADWRQAIEQSTGEDLRWFFDQTLDDTTVLDYAVTRLDVRTIKPLRGVGASQEHPTSADTRYRTEVIVERLGGVRMPVDIAVVFEDGSISRESWDGRARWRRLEITSKRRADFAVVDPDQKLPLDVNWINNSRMRSAGTRGVVRLAARWGFWMQSLLHAATGF